MCSLNLSLVRDMEETTPNARWPMSNGPRPVADDFRRPGFSARPANRQLPELRPSWQNSSQLRDIQMNYIFLHFILLDQNSIGI